MTAIKYVKVQSLPQVDDFDILNRVLHTIDDELTKIARVLNNINTDNIPDGSITSGKIADGAVLTAKLYNAAVEAEKIATGAIIEAKIAADAVTAAKIAVAGLDGTTGNVAANHIVANMLQSNCVTTVKLQADSVTAPKINVVGLNGATGRIVVADQTDADVVTGGINSHAVTLIQAGKIIISGAVNLDDWRHGSDTTLIDGGKIYAQSITATQILAGTITANEIFANTITIGEIKIGTQLNEMFTDFFTVSTTGNDPWVGALFGGSLTAVAGESNHPGIVRFAADTDTEGCRFMTATDCIIIAGQEYSEFCFRPNSLLNARMRLGYQDSLTATLPTDGVFIYIEGTDLMGYTRDTGSGSTTGTGYTISTGTWYRGTIEMNSDATLVTFTLYNAAGSQLWSDTLAANIPAGALGHGVVMYVGASVARSIDIDMMLATYAGELTR